MPSLSRIAAWLGLRVGLDLFNGKVTVTRVWVFVVMARKMAMTYQIEEGTLDEKHLLVDDKNEKENRE